MPPIITDTGTRNVIFPAPLSPLEPIINRDPGDESNHRSIEQARADAKRMWQRIAFPEVFHDDPRKPW